MRPPLQPVCVALETRPQNPSELGEEPLFIGVFGDFQPEIRE